MKRITQKRAGISILSLLLLLFLLAGCAAPTPEPSADRLGNGWQVERSMELQYAENFRVDYYHGGYALLTISDGSRYLVVPQNAADPEGIDAAITVLHQPIQNIYLVASATMCLFDALDSLDKIRLTGTKLEDWSIESAKAAMEAGDILFAGKYDAPDYERILSNSCSLAIESTMINHAPEVKEKLEEVGVPVLIDQSSYESHPLGRTEWIKLYGVLVGQEAAAEQLFEEQVAYMDEVISQKNTGKTVAFFYINSSGNAVARKSGDYITKIIELAGGNYIFDQLGDPETATSTVPVEMEQFYATAKDADFIIYNSTIDGEVSTVDELIQKNALLKDFKAVQNGNVWCTGRNLYQETNQLGLMISDIHEMLTSEDENLTKLHFIHKLL